MTQWIRKVILVCVLILGIVPSLGNAQESEDDEKKTTRRSSHQMYAMVGTWREHSILTRTDGVEFKINTLNTVGRLGMTHYMSGAKYFLRYGLAAGHSANGSAIDDFAYFQRSVLLAGAEAAVGVPFFLSPGVEMSATLGGVFRTISHSLPSNDYKFKTASQFVPLATLEFLWRLSSSIYWRQGVGTQGKVGDTYWTAGLGYDL